MNNNVEKREMWEERIKEYRSSGQSASKWCEEKEYKLSRLRYWIHKFNKEKAANDPVPKWASVEVKNPVMAQVHPIKITIGKSSIEVNSGFDPATFEKVIRILSQEC